MKKLLLFLLVLVFTQGLMAQVYVSTTPQNKKVLLEEFTGTGCPNCPGGHAMAASLLVANPGNLFVIAYHPTNSNYTSTDPMRNAFGNAFYTNPFIAPTNRYMPSAMIGRRVWGGIERIQGVSSWTGDVATIMGEPSPLNVGLSSTYDPGTHLLSITAEVYCTADVTDAITLYTVLTEDGIIATQSGGTSPYTHNHVFRAAIPQPNPAQWGEPITGPTTSGSLTTVTYTFDNTSTNYDMTQCELVVFVRNAADEEIISANGAKVGLSTGISTPHDASAVKFDVFPNPVNDLSRLRLTLDEPGSISYTITDAIGQQIAVKNLGVLSAGQHQLNLNTQMLSNGLYFITLTDGKNSSTLKIVK